MVLAQPFFVIVQYTELHFMVLAQPFFVIVQYTELHFMVLAQRPNIIQINMSLGHIFILSLI
jgi:hypothetical protein